MTSPTSPTRPLSYGDQQPQRQKQERIAVVASSANEGRGRRRGGDDGGVSPGGSGGREMRTAGADDGGVEGEGGGKDNTSFSKQKILRRRFTGLLAGRFQHPFDQVGRIVQHVTTCFLVCC